MAMGNTPTFKLVSTHSRPKAAGILAEKPSLATLFQHTAARRRLVRRVMWTADKDGSFNTQPPEGGWQARLYYVHQISVSTHSRPKAAGPLISKSLISLMVSTHSRPKAAGQARLYYVHQISVSTHSRPKAAGWIMVFLRP